MTTLEEVKRCSTCSEEKPTSAFFKDNRNGSLRARCKACTRIENQSWASRNRESTRRHTREWRARNPFWSAVKQSSRRAKRWGVVDDLTVEQWQEVFDSYGGMCAYCLIASATDIEHVIPISQGGGHTKSNVVPSCNPCNHAKSWGTLVPHLVSKFWPPTEHLLAGVS